MSTLQNQANQRVEMGYLVDFEKAIENHDAPSILRLWEEYTSTDELDAEDFRDILEAVKASELRDYIGRHVERGIPLWEKVEKGPLSDDILRLIVDLQVTNNEELRKITLNHLHEKFGHEEDFPEKMRLIGFRTDQNDFQSAISHYILLNHMKKGNFVFHNAGWGVGEIMDISMLREQLSLEFDYAPGIKEMHFSTAFNALIPIPDDHFLALRFGSPDQLEVQAKEKPVEVIRMVLRDLGPLNAAEIKDELCELVIPEKEWNRWWQSTRTKIKKDPQIENPDSIKEPFRLLKQEVSHEDRLKKALDKKPDPDTLIHMVHSFLKDFSDTLKNPAFKESLLAKLKELLSFKEITEAQEIQLQFFLQDLSGAKEYPPVAELLKKTASIETLIKNIPIQAFKKRVLTAVRQYREDWEKIFLDLFLVVDHNSLRDYMISELTASPSKDKLTDKIKELSLHPHIYPEVVVWYFQKITENGPLPFANDEGRSRFLEAFLLALSHLEQKNERRDLVKKMHAILSAGRYSIVRKIMKEAETADVQEFLLLVTKCHSLTDHDIKIFYALAEVAHPSLKKKRKKEQKAKQDDDVIWTTKEGYAYLQQKIEHIGTIETVENAKEIEVARSHGDLRENAEFKAALEKRDRLQSELKFLSDQLNQCRILTKDDIDVKQVSVGTTIDCKNSDGELVSYTLLGPWDADPDKNILSFQSKLAQSMLELKKGDTFEFQGKQMTIVDIRSAI